MSLKFNGIVKVEPPKQESIRDEKTNKVEIDQFVKEKPAAVMKEAADILTGSHLSDYRKSEGCPADMMKTVCCDCG